MATELGISIHVLREEDDSARIFKISCALYFYPRPPRGGRLTQSATRRATAAFLSTSSARRTTNLKLGYGGTQEDFYPRPPRGGRRNAERLQRP